MNSAFELNPREYRNSYPAPKYVKLQVCVLRRPRHSAVPAHLVCVVNQSSRLTINCFVRYLFTIICIMDVLGSTDRRNESFTSVVPKVVSIEGNIGKLFCCTEKFLILIGLRVYRLTLFID